MRAYPVAVRGFNFKLMTYQKVISAPLRRKDAYEAVSCLLNEIGHVRMPRFSSEVKPNTKSLPNRLFSKSSSSPKIDISPIFPILL